MRYGSEPRSRSLKIHNDSCVSLTVAWHIFMKERIVSRDEAEKEMLFNIVLDVYSAVNDAGETSFHCQDTEDCCNKCIKKDKEKQEVMEMNLVPYIGKEDYTFFQTIKLKLCIEFPIITVSTQKIDFGPVFVGNSKWMVFEIVNQTVSNVWFNISKVYQTNEFSVKPSSGTLSAAPLYGRSGLQIKITFSPTESMSYMDYLRVQTCVPGDDHIVVIEGVGTADTKFQSDF
ncbi:Protein of unknown function [Gryllus bimaculatus]|nr:Protein of unknown function [Gryllus bimaculatus]